MPKIFDKLLGKFKKEVQVAAKLASELRKTGSSGVREDESFKRKDHKGLKSASLKQEYDDFNKVYYDSLLTYENIAVLLRSSLSEKIFSYRDLDEKIKSNFEQAPILYTGLEGNLLFRDAILYFLANIEKQDRFTIFLCDGKVNHRGEISGDASHWTVLHLRKFDELIIPFHADSSRGDKHYSLLKSLLNSFKDIKEADLYEKYEQGTFISDLNQRAIKALPKFNFAELVSVTSSVQDNGYDCGLFAAYNAIAFDESGEIKPEDKLQISDVDVDDYVAKNRARLEFEIKIPEICEDLFGFADKIVSNKRMKNVPLKKIYGICLAKELILKRIEFLDKSQEDSFEEELVLLKNSVESFNFEKYSKDFLQEFSQGMIDFVTSKKGSADADFIESAFEYSEKFTSDSFLNSLLDEVDFDGKKKKCFEHIYKISRQKPLSIKKLFDLADSALSKVPTPSPYDPKAAIEERGVPETAL